MAKIATKNHVIAFAWVILIAISPLEHVPSLRIMLIAILFCFFLVTDWRKVLEPYVKAVPMGAWVVFCALSSFWSLRPQSTIHNLKADLLPGILAFAVSYCLASKEKSDRILSLAMLFCSVTNATVAVLGLSFKNDFFFQFYADVGFSSTIASLTLMYGIVGLMLVHRSPTSWIIVICSLAAGGLSANRMFLVICCLLFVLFALHAVFLRRSLWLLFYGFVFLGVLGAAMFVAGSTMAGKIANTMTTMQDPRFAIYEYWVRLGLDHPWLGIGFGRNVGQYTLGAEHAEALTKIDPLSVMHSHNLFINSFVETGVIGLSLFCLMWFSFAIRFARQVRQNEYAFIGLSVICVFLLKNMTDIFFLKSTAVLLMCILGFCYGKLGNKTGESV